MNYFVVKIRV